MLKTNKRVRYGAIDAHRFLDGSYSKAHQHSSGVSGGQEAAIGKSRAGNTTKIHMAVDAHGNPIEFEITGGQVNDCTIAPDIIIKLPKGGHVVADKGYDSNINCHKI